MAVQDPVRKPRGFFSKNQVATLFELEIINGSACPGLDQCERRVHRKGVEEFIRRFMDSHIEVLPIIKPRAFQGLGVDAESKRLYQMKSAPGGKTEPADGAGVLRDLGLDQNYVKIRFIHRVRAEWC